MQHDDTTGQTDPTATPRVCPRCSWHQPPGARLCAACGIVFAKYAAAERRRRARAMTAALAPVPVARDDDDGDAIDGAAFDGVAFDGAAPVGVVDVVASAARGAFAATVPLVALQVLPLILAVGLGAGAAIVAPGLVAFAARAGFAPLAIVGAFALLVILRASGAVLAGALVAVDDAIRGVERGVFDTLGEGWVRGGRVVGVQVILAIAMLPGLAPFAGLALSGASSGALLAGFAVAVVVGVGAMVRLCLALPLAVLGERGVIEALQESWTVTGRAPGLVVKALLLGGVVALAASLVGSLFAVIPVLGWLAAVVIQSVVQGFSLGLTGQLFRRLA